MDCREQKVITIRRRSLELAFAPVIAVFLLTLTVHESIGQERRAGSAGVAVKPIYNPESKSYFELRVDLPKPPNWQTAVRYARTKFYKGVRGRLAVVKDLQTHSFLQANFDVREEAWIGLRYFCSFRKLVWENGEEQPRRAFKMWAKRWHRTDIRCGNNRIQYMPIYYLPNSKGFKWQASGPAKYFVSYFVEYQTGAEDPKDAPKPEKKPDAGAPQKSNEQKSDESETPKPTPDAPTAEAKPGDAKPAKE